MFFAETLGPLLTAPTANALMRHLKAKLSGRKTVPAAELREAVAEFLAKQGVGATPEAAIGLLARTGRIVFDDPGSCKIAA